MQINLETAFLLSCMIGSVFDSKRNYYYRIKSEWISLSDKCPNQHLHKVKN